MKFMAMLTTLSIAAAFGAVAQDGQTYAEKLGWPKGAKVVIFHVDDAGMHHDANMGMLDAITKGVGTSTSVMYPCPWVTEAAKLYKENPKLDIGVHTTLTSEWKDYRWAPLAGKSAVPGLVDEEGCFWHEVPQVMMHATADEVETEIRAQVDRAYAVGIPPTHIDTHMGTVFAKPEYFERYLKIGIEKHIPVMLPAGHMTYVSASREGLNIEQVREAGKKAWDAGLPVLDDLHTGSLEKGPEFKKQQIIDFLNTLKPGVTQFIVHCTKPTEMFQHISGSGKMREAEMEALMSPEVAKAVKDNGIILTTWREMKERRDAVK